MPVGHDFPDIVSLNYSRFQLNVDGPIHIDSCHLIWPMQSGIHLGWIIVLNPHSVSDLVVVIDTFLIFSDEIGIYQLLLSAANGIKITQEWHINHHVSVEYKSSWRGPHSLVNGTSQGMNAAV